MKRKYARLIENVDLCTFNLYIILIFYLNYFQIFNINMSRLSFCLDSKLSVLEILFFIYVSAMIELK